MGRKGKSEVQKGRIDLSRTVPFFLFFRIGVIYHLDMDTKLYKVLEDVFSRSLSALSLRTRDSLEVPVTIEGRKRKADIHETLLKGELFRLYSRRVTVHESVGRERIEEEVYEFNRSPIPEFSLKDVLSLLSASGYEVPSYLEGDYDENIPIDNVLIHRNDKGVSRFFRELRNKGIRKEVLTLSYISEGDGAFALDLEIVASDIIDTGNLSHKDLGFLDYYDEVSEEKKKAMIRYLMLLSTFNMYAGLESIGLVDYYTFIEKMQAETGKKDWSLSIRKEHNSLSDDPNYGGEGYQSFGVNPTPLDFSWYVNGFKDTKEQRKAFFSYYDERMKLEEARSEENEVGYYLSLLGLSEDATFDDVTKAYRELSLRFHPDRIEGYNLDEAFTDFAKSRMQMINEAYEYLKTHLGK